MRTGLGTGLTGAVVAEALIRGFADSYRCEMPGDAECLKRLGPTQSGNPLHDLILARAVAPENSLRLGLIVLGVTAMVWVLQIEPPICVVKAR